VQATDILLFNDYDI